LDRSVVGGQARQRFANDYFLAGRNLGWWIKGSSGLYTYLQAVQGYLAPPIFVVFFFGVVFKQLNAAGALWAMVAGFGPGNFACWLIRRLLSV
jgi:Na+/proline symporter